MASPSSKPPPDSKAVVPAASQPPSSASLSCGPNLDIDHKTYSELKEAGYCFTCGTLPCKLQKEVKETHQTVQGKINFLAGASGAQISKGIAKSIATAKATIPAVKKALQAKLHESKDQVASSYASVSATLSGASNSADSKLSFVSSATAAATVAAEQVAQHLPEVLIEQKEIAEVIQQAADATASAYASLPPAQRTEADVLQSLVRKQLRAVLSLMILESLGVISPVVTNPAAQAAAPAPAHAAAPAPAPAPAPAAAAAAAAATNDTTLDLLDSALADALQRLASPEVMELVNEVIACTLRGEEGAWASPIVQDEQIVWLDAAWRSAENMRYLADFRQLPDFSDVRPFEKLCDAVSYIESQPLCSFMVLSSGALCRDLIPAVSRQMVGVRERKPNINRFFVFCLKLALHNEVKQQYPSVVDGVFNTVRDVKTALTNSTEQLSVFVSPAAWMCRYGYAVSLASDRRVLAASEALTTQECVEEFLRLAELPTTHATQQIREELTGLFQPGNATQLTYARRMVKLYSRATDPPFYRVINKQLRSSHKGKLFKVVRMATDLITAMKTVANDSTATQVVDKFQENDSTVVYRGIKSLDAEAMAKYRTAQPNSLLYFREFLSTSIAPTTANRFRSSHDPNTNSVLFKIDCANLAQMDKSGSQPVFLGSTELTHFMSEEEVLFPPLTLFEVDSVQNDSATMVTVNLKLKRLLPLLHPAVLVAVL